MGTRHVVTALVLSVAACASPPAPRPGGSYEYEMPQLATKLHAPNFEYVRFGVTGVAQMDPIRRRMFKREEIGLVNLALEDLYRKVPMEGGPYALVNVVTDVSSTRVFRIVQDNNGTRETLIDAFPNTLVIRADVVRFRLVNLENPPAHPLTDAGRAGLRDVVLAALATRLGPAVD
ncbi:MAG: hypothetical protein HY904_13495 [Deltaproteobacteria bacterium]|nr:hypothetical protein [Deltaproteobacteria bacterium]